MDDFVLGRTCPTEPVTDPKTGATICELPGQPSGEPGQGRTCRKPYELDPTGQAYVCADPCDPTRIKEGGDCLTTQPSPTPAALPTVGASANIWLPLACAVLVAVLVFVISNRKK